MDTDLGLFISAQGVLVFVYGCRDVCALLRGHTYSSFLCAAEMYFLLRKKSLWGYVLMDQKKRGGNKCISAITFHF